jgi:hypothetical protein
MRAVVVEDGTGTVDDFLVALDLGYDLFLDFEGGGRGIWSSQNLVFEISLNVPPVAHACMVGTSLVRARATYSGNTRDRFWITTFLNP